ncbi:MAG: helix-hairpin-helix domain-containing protein [Actinomycetota bacterium]|nr:helix-hairpin-helix domain-containing protein [Actinomycetota bacterium]
MATRNDVLAMLSELASLTTLAEQSNQSFKVRAYEKARHALEAETCDITALPLKDLLKIDGVGKATAEKVRELIDNGSVAKLEKLREEFPPSVVELSRIPGMGPKTVQLVRTHLGVEDLDGLREAIAAQKLRTLPGLGATSEQKIAKAIERLGLTGKDRRTPIADAHPVASRLVDDLKAVDSVVDVQFCGSLRRMAETIGDVDIVVAATDAATVMEAVRNHGDCYEIVVTGDSKTSFLTASGLQVDVRVVEPDQLGAATLYFTGSKAHNVELRQRALRRNMTLNEYGLFELIVPDEPDADAVAENGDDADGEAAKPQRQVGDLIVSRTEEEIYEALGLAYIAAPLREGAGEVGAADRGELPELIERRHIRGDLHYHTDRSGDGRSPLAAMVKVAADLGYEYLAITDHGEDLVINGSNRQQMLAHRDAIRRLQADYPDMTILWGCELNIGASGGLDYDDEFRASFDYTVASVHSHFDQAQAKQTDRLLAAIADPTVNSIGHLTGRYIGRRPGIEIDVDAVLDALVEHDTALEINGALDRLDAASPVVRKAVEREVKLVINTDSHHTSELGRMEYGVLTAQRGWAPRSLVVNSWDRATFLRWIGYEPDA